MTTHSKLSAYGLSFQIKVLSLFLTNKELLINIRDSVDSNLFDDEAHKWIVDFTLKYYDKYHTHPSIDVIHVEVKKIPNEILRTSVIEQLREIYKSCDGDDLNYVKDEFFNFCTNQEVKKALLTSVDLLKLGDYDGIKSLMANALKSGQDKNVGLIYEKDVESRYRDEERSPIPYPWKSFNEITQGGYGKGELIILFGNPKGGKSWIAIAMAAHAAWLGYSVVYYTLELSENYVGRRFDAVLTEIALDKLKDNKVEIEKKIAEVKGKIIIKEYSAGRASLDTIEAHLDQMENQYSFKPDAIFCDYLDLLKNRNVFRKEKREDLDDVYTDARGLARDRKVPFISPSQVNRAGAQDKVIEGDKIAGSYGKYAIADFLVSLSRKSKDKKEGTGRFHIMGSRVGPDGLTYFAKINTTNGKIEINEKPLDLDEEEEEDDKYSKPGEIDNLSKKHLRSRFLEGSK